MSRLGREISRGFKTLGRALDHPTFTFKDKEIEYIKSMETGSKLFGEGGLAPSADLVLFVDVGWLPDVPPAEKDEIIFKGRTYRIDDIEDLPGDGQLKYVCYDPERDA